MRMLDTEVSAGEWVVRPGEVKRAAWLASLRRIIAFGQTAHGERNQTCQRAILPARIPHGMRQLD